MGNEYERFELQFIAQDVYATTCAAVEQAYLKIHMRRRSEHDGTERRHEPVPHELGSRLHRQTSQSVCADSLCRESVPNLCAESSAATNRRIFDAVRAI